MGMKRYFLVCCKCGHVGRNRYIPLVYPIRADSAREAAARGRQRPGVKHHHPDAILWVSEATSEEYYETAVSLKKDLYWEGARGNLGFLSDRLKIDTRNIKLTNDTLYFNRKAARRFRQARNKAVEAELREYVAREYGMPI
jgi:hypothetical protein